MPMGNSKFTSDKITEENLAPRGSGHLVLESVKEAF
jgi:hypothetical protein